MSWALAAKRERISDGILQSCFPLWLLKMAPAKQFRLQVCSGCGELYICAFSQQWKKNSFSEWLLHWILRGLGKNAIILMKETFACLVFPLPMNIFWMVSYWRVCNYCCQLLQVHQPQMFHCQQSSCIERTPGRLRASWIFTDNIMDQYISDFQKYFLHPRDAN